MVGGRLRGVCGGAFRVCLYWGGCRWFGWFAAHVGRFGSGGPPYPYRVAHPLDIPFPLRVCAFAHSYLRDTLTKY